ncbi:unnamed protein product [Cylindrotheca closterium]|uniref:Uncharacterized protein n=1 Tax=Cylindrotheca closterium TaxID=2856 RepID=A0AAD2FWN1_9STRA|nr:unnamed protein product [Cylindrotheca closterium]
MVDPNSKPGAPKPTTVLNRRRRTVPTDSSVPLYHPSIFRYTCRGKFSLDSRVSSAGVCKGIQSKLEHVDHWRLTTKDEAIRVFEHKSGEHEAPSRGPTFDQQDNNTAAAQSLELVDVSNVLVYPSNEKEEGKSSPKDGRQEKWRCYGSTEVDLLVLRPQGSKEETIAAIAPYCAPGSSVRDVSSPSLGLDRTTTIRLGVLEILYQSSLAEDDNDDPIADDERKKPVPAQTQAANPDAPRFPIRFLNSANTVMKQMKINAHTVYQATQEDFPERTMSASRRVVNEFGKTIDRTTSLMKRVIFWDWDSDSKGR